MSVFVDTSALYALMDAGESNHADAVMVFTQFAMENDLVTHNYVHIEVDALVRARLGREAAGDLADRVLPTLTTVWVDEETHRAALDATRARSRRIAFVDEVSFVVMRRLGITEAFAYDRDFESEGFPRPRLQDGPSHQLSESRLPYGQALVSVSEIAARAGRSVNTVQSWRRRHADFPVPVVELRAGPVWNWPEVDRWIRRRGRPRRPQPTVPLFESGIEDLASRVDEQLDGFGER